MFTEFTRHLAAATLYPAPTQKAAISEARALGCMIRREGAEAGEARGFLVYPVGSPDTALYAACHAEALALADALAHDMTANRLSMFGSRPTLRGMAESVASRAAKVAGLSAGDVAVTVSPANSKGRVRVAFSAGAAKGSAIIEPREMVAAQIICDIAPAAEYVANEYAAELVSVARAEGIEIGETGSDWHGMGDFYAQRLPAGEFEFGMSAIAALSALREREARIAAMFAEKKAAALAKAAPAPRSLSAAANPDAPRRKPRARRMARNRAELVAELARAEREGDQLAAELARGSMTAAAGGFPLYAWSDSRALDADALDALAYGAATGGLL